MEEYATVRSLGRGSFGAVTLCRSKTSAELVAIKFLTDRDYKTWNECLTKREVKALRAIGAHPFIVRLQKVIHEPTTKRLYLIFNYCPSNLHQAIREKRKRRGAGYADKRTPDPFGLPPRGPSRDAHKVRSKAQGDSHLKKSPLGQYSSSRPSTTCTREDTFIAISSPKIFSWHLTERFALQTLDARGRFGRRLRTLYT